MKEEDDFNKCDFCGTVSEDVEYRINPIWKRSSMKKYGNIYVMIVTMNI